jgi:hypothetical protein
MRGRWETEPGSAAMIAVLGPSGYASASFNHEVHEVHEGKPWSIRNFVTFVTFVVKAFED